MPRILITGGLGFIGSHAAIKFANKEYDVVVIDNLSRPSPNLQKIQGPEFNWSFFDKEYPKITKIKADIRNFDMLFEIFKKYQPDAVIHAAGQTSAVGSVIDPSNDFSNNVVGLFNTLESARRVGSVKNFIFLSTNKVYGDLPNTVPLIENEDRYIPKDSSFNGIKEDFPLNPSKHTPYGASKLSGDIYVQEYGQLYEMNTVVFRMSCIYGDRQFGFVEQGWIAHLCIQALLNHEITIFGNGKQVRDILYIDDLTELYYQYLHQSLIDKNKRLQGSLVFNIGGGFKNSLSLKESLKIIEDLVGHKLNLNYDEWRPGDQRLYVSDITKVNEFLGWTPKISPEKGIEMTFKWLRNHIQLFK